MLSVFLTSSYLKKNADEGHARAKYCLALLERAVQNRLQRKSPPSLAELAALKVLKLMNFYSISSLQ
jgi:hypothetical protein